jgi:hypothetical protein
MASRHHYCPLLHADRLTIGAPATASGCSGACVKDRLERWKREKQWLFSHFFNDLLGPPIRVGNAGSIRVGAIRHETKAGVRLLLTSPEFDDFWLLYNDLNDAGHLMFQWWISNQPSSNFKRTLIEGHYVRHRELNDMVVTLQLAADGVELAQEQSLICCIGMNGGILATLQANLVETTVGQFRAVLCQQLPVGRVANDFNIYLFSEVVDRYGKEKGLKMWDSAWETVNLRLVSQNGLLLDNASTILSDVLCARRYVLFHSICWTPTMSLFAINYFIS